MKLIKIFIPYSINYILFESIKNKSYNLYLYNDSYYFSLNTMSNNTYINKDSNVIFIRSNQYNNYNMLMKNQLNNFLFSWDNIFFNKIKFTGKGFKFKKKINNLFLFFNRAHKCFFIGNNTILKRLSKNKIILLKNNYNHLIWDSILIRRIRSNNIFTKRGLRFSRQLILKKKGKTAAR